MTTTHTPGPWTVSNRAGKRPATIVRDANENEVCEVYAAARLIAAAPDLLAALQEAFRAFAFDEDGPVWADSTIAKARAAIARATGEA